MIRPQQTMSVAEYKAIASKPTKKNKFGAKKVKADGYTFDSTREHQRYCELKIKQRIGEIADLKVHPKFHINVNDTDICTFTADTSYLEFYPFGDGKATRFIVEDVKSEITAKLRGFVLVKKLMKAVHNIDVRVVH